MRTVKLEIALTWNNSLKTRNNSLNLLRADPGGPGQGGPRNLGKTVRNGTKRYAELIVRRLYSISVGFLPIFLELNLNPDVKFDKKIKAHSKTKDIASFC